MKLYLFATLFIFLAFGFTPEKATTTVTGSVVDSRTGHPVTGAYIIAIAGEEETLTDQQGKFNLRTSLKLPAKISIKHKDYVDTTYTLQDTGNNIAMRQSQHE